MTATPNRIREVQITREYSAGSPVWTNAAVLSVPYDQTVLSIPVIGGTKYAARTRFQDVFGNFGSWSTIAEHTTTAGPDSVAVTNTGATVTIDSTGIHILDGFLSIEDAFGEVTLGSTGFKGSWLQTQYSGGIFNSELNVGSTSDIPVTEVGTADTLADYAASLGSGLPYWVVSASGPNLRIVTDTEVDNWNNDKCLASTSTGAAQVSRFYQDIPIGQSELYFGFKMNFRVTDLRSGTIIVKVFASGRDATHAIIDGRNQRDLLTFSSTDYEDDIILGTATTNLIESQTFVHDGQLIYFRALTGGAGLVNGTGYYVRDVTPGESFKVSSTLGGPVFDFTTDITAGKVQNFYGNSTGDNITSLLNSGTDPNTAYMRVELEITHSASGSSIELGRVQLTKSLELIEMDVDSLSVGEWFSSPVVEVGSSTFAYRQDFTGPFEPQLVVLDTNTFAGDPDSDLMDASTGLHVGGHIFIGGFQDGAVDYFQPRHGAINAAVRQSKSLLFR